MYTVSYEVEHTFSNEDIQNIFITACEGGINYWTDVLDYDYVNMTAHLFDYEGEKHYNINRDTIEQGLRRASRQAIPVLEAIAIEDYDAYDADIVVQLGLFGEIVYG